MFLVIFGCSTLLNTIIVFSICVLASFVRHGAKDRNDTAVNISTKGHCKIIPE